MAFFSEFADEAQKLVAAGMGAAAASFVAWFKLKRQAASDDKATSADSATTAVIELLRGEVTRLYHQNASLANTVNTLQTQMMTLHQENIDLRKSILRLEKCQPNQSI